MPIRLYPSLFIAFFCCQLTALAQNGPPTIDQVRAGSQQTNATLQHAPQPPVFRLEQRNVWGGSDSIPIRIYYPKASRNLPLLFNVHGNSLVFQNQQPEGALSAVLCNQLQVIVVSLDYRVAPEHPFPASIEDCTQVFNWISKHTQTLGADSAKLMLVGDSSGGLFATAMQLKLQQQQRKARLLAQVLINPATDLRLTAAGRERPFYALVASWYLGKADPATALASPILAPDFHIFPPTLVVVCEQDVLKPQGLAFAQKLQAAGVPTKVVELAGLDHFGPTWSIVDPYVQPGLDAAVAYLQQVLSAKNTK